MVRSRTSLRSSVTRHLTTTSKTTLAKQIIWLIYLPRSRVLTMANPRCSITYRGGDLIMAFFPCIYFCDNSQILHTWGAHQKADCRTATERILVRSRNRQRYYELIVKLFATAKERGLKLIVENPLGMHSYLRSCFVTQPAVIDKHRNHRGDEFAKPTGYWYINCEPTFGESYQPKEAKRVKKDAKGSSQAGVCSEERSMISPDYARNFICDFIIGNAQPFTQQTLF